MTLLKTCRQYLITFLAASLLLLLVLSPAESASLQWVKQLGTGNEDFSTATSADGLGNVYVSGTTYGNLGGPIANGDRDAFVSKYDENGNCIWTRQFGTGDVDESHGVSADGLGNVYVSGLTWGSLGGPNAGAGDSFISKFDAAGNLLWNRQLGSSQYEESYGVSADRLGNVYISGFTTGNLQGSSAGSYDAFVSKYDRDGSLIWTRQIGTSSVDISQGVSADALGNVFITGYTRGSLGGPLSGGDDAFVSEYDSSGNLIWSRQLGTDDSDISYAVTADGLGNVFIGGGTHGSLGSPNAGSDDAFISKLNTAGSFLWTRQIGTNETDVIRAVSSDNLGSVVASGHTRGDLAGPNSGPRDAFVSKFDSLGAAIWMYQLGSSGDDYSVGVSSDSLGNIFISGQTDGILGSPNIGGSDGFVAKFSEVPEPGTSLLAMLGCLGFLLLANPFREAYLDEEFV